MFKIKDVPLRVSLGTIICTIFKYEKSAPVFPFDFRTADIPEERKILENVPFIDECIVSIEISIVSKSANRPIPTKVKRRGSMDEAYILMKVQYTGIRENIESVMEGSNSGFFALDDT